MTNAQKAALAVYFDAGRDYGKQMLACLSIKWHAKVAGALEVQGLLERHAAPREGMFSITPLGRYYAIENAQKEGQADG